MAIRIVVNIPKNPFDFLEGAPLSRKYLWFSYRKYQKSFNACLVDPVFYLGTPRRNYKYDKPFPLTCFKEMETLLQEKYTRCCNLGIVCILSTAPIKFRAGKIMIEGPAGYGLLEKDRSLSLYQDFSMNVRSEQDLNIVIECFDVLRKEVETKLPELLKSIPHEYFNDRELSSAPS